MVRTTAAIFPPGCRSISDSSHASPIRAPEGASKISTARMGLANARPVIPGREALGFASKRIGVTPAKSFNDSSAGAQTADVNVLRHQQRAAAIGPTASVVMPDAAPFADASEANVKGVAARIGRIDHQCGHLRRKYGGCGAAHLSDQRAGGPRRAGACVRVDGAGIGSRRHAPLPISDGSVMKTWHFEAVSPRKERPQFLDTAIAAEHSVVVFNFSVHSLLRNNSYLVHEKFSCGFGNPVI